MQAISILTNLFIFSLTYSFDTPYNSCAITYNVSSVVKIASFCMQKLFELFKRGEITLCSDTPET